MKNTNETSIFTNEQLGQMSPDHLRELCLLMGTQIKKQEEQIKSQENTIKLKEDKLRELEFLNTMLSEQLTLAQKKRFGSSSEKNADGYEQLNLFNEAESVADPEASEPEYEEIHYNRKKVKGKKENDLSVFEVETIKHKLSGDELICDDCGHKLKVVSTEVCRTLKFIPAQFITVEDIVYIYSCTGCSKMIRTKKDPSLLKGSIATPSLVAGIMNSKYVNGVPLYRQSQEFKRYGLNLEDKTMANWMIRCSEDYLYLIYERMIRALLKGQYIHCDETRCQVLDEPDQKASTKNWMWVYMTDTLSGGPQMVIFQYERTRGGYHPKTFLDGYYGYLTTDGYSAYHGLPESIIVTGCMAHARRRYDECLTILKIDLKNGEWKNSIAYEALTRIGKLYEIEESIRECSPEQRYQVRQEQAKPVAEAYFAWLHSMDTDELDHKSKIGDAILYSINQEKYLLRYLEDGHLAIDNNDCERSIKTFGIGRRNWLFCKSIVGAQASAIIYSITETAKLNGLRPYFYLSHLLDTMRFHHTDTNYDFIDNLLPWSSNLPENCYARKK